MVLNNQNYNDKFDARKGHFYLMLSSKGVKQLGLRIYDK